MVLFLGALLFLLIRYVEQQRSTHQAAKLALLIVAPALLLTLVDLALPLDEKLMATQEIILSYSL